MLSWIKRLLGKNASAEMVVGNAAQNKYFIEKYKDFDKVIKTYYQAKDTAGKTINIDGIVNPLKIDNRQQFSVIDNQGSLPHCAAYSICGICEAVIWKKTGKLINLDANQVYARAKEIDGEVDSDGTYLEAAIKAAFELGGFDGASIKIGQIYNDGSDEMVEMVKFLIHKYDFLHAGFQINEGWYSATQDEYVIRDWGRGLGGHAVCLVGYSSEGVYIANSWGSSWASKGFGVLPWDSFKKQFMYACYLQGSLTI